MYLEAKFPLNCISLIPLGIIFVVIIIIYLILKKKEQQNYLKNYLKNMEKINEMRSNEEI